MTDKKTATISVNLRVQILPHAEDLPPPEYQSALAAGFDLPAAVEETSPILIAPGEYALVPTGLAVELPPGYEGQVRPRSGLAAKYGITVLNTPGTIDADYRGEIKVILVNHGKQPFTVTRGTRIAQLVVNQIARAEFDFVVDLTPTDRATGGFGSTGTT